MAAALYPGVCDLCETTWPIGADIVPWNGHHAHRVCVEREVGE